MNYKLKFYKSKFNDLIVNYELNDLLDIPSSLATLAKTKDNDQLIINTIKSTILPHLPRELEDPKRLDLLSMLKVVHDLEFSIVDSDDSVIYYGSSIDTDENEETIEIVADIPVKHRLSIQDLSLVELLKIKQNLEKELQTVNQELDKQLVVAWDIINEKLTRLNHIKTKWEHLSASELNSDSIQIIQTVQDNLVNLPSEELIVSFD